MQSESSGQLLKSLMWLHLHTALVADQTLLSPEPALQLVISRRRPSVYQQFTLMPEQHATPELTSFCLLWQLLHPACHSPPKIAPQKATLSQPFHHPQLIVWKLCSVLVQLIESEPGARNKSRRRRQRHCCRFCATFSVLSLWSANFSQLFLHNAPRKHIRPTECWPQLCCLGR